MYKSPIDIIYGQLQTQIEGEVMRAVQQIGVNVDKEELLRALQYDRGQYKKGYADAMDSIVRCKDCKYYTYDGYHKHNYCSNSRGMRYIVLQEYFCSYGERREGE